MTEIKRPWWKNAVVYQIYPKSFQDSNGDGIGDIRGIISRLDYLEELGIDAVWISPMYCSPQDDNGYDISDYQDIDPMFGSLDDMEELIAKAKEKNIRIIMDLVLNHTSDEHRWFLEAKKGKDNPYHDYYVWKDGVEGTYPNDMKAAFGGPAWEWVPELNQYYFHQFSVKQPDLNWENPKVRREIYDMILWWMEKGVGGFRLDVIDQIAKEPDNGITNNGPRLHEFLQEMSRETFQKGDLITVGEAWGATPKIAKLYSNPDGTEFSMVFQFEHMVMDQQEGKEKWDLAPLPFVKLKKCLAKWQEELYGRGWNSLFWDNHDLPRIVSRWGDDGKYRKESAKMLALVLHGMQGTPYVYQGEELGMTNVRFPDISSYEDIETLNMYRERLDAGYKEDEIMKSIYAKSRDNARTPMQWSGEKNAGFTTGKPWIRVNPNYTDINAESEKKDPDSVYHFYRKLIRMRKEYPVFVDGKFELLLPEDEQVFAYLRTDSDTQMLVCANFTGEPAECQISGEWKEAQILLHNYADDVPECGESLQLKPYEAFILLKQ
ncbi:glucohydrolase [Lachnoclostridium sp. An298]|uniref:glycoside hydrolase family 13 protein n=1 Tax=Mediterraneibacter glycyrrhizinilyticus TaxID=342942 RepID=UPI000B379D8F|nr:alpha-glucosidase [Mediterraneibacter glycyrrhizinilyticus]MDN0060270.1 alpha-glucosidase [Mediterraneibacter glycyrrhizinilyticus]OUO27734.1 glucohydrolase [Lachnoclostridium sp. An298]